MDKLDDLFRDRAVELLVRYDSSPLAIRMDRLTKHFGDPFLMYSSPFLAEYRGSPGASREVVPAFNGGREVGKLVIPIKTNWKQNMIDKSVTIGL